MLFIFQDRRSLMTPPLTKPLDSERNCSKDDRRAARCRQRTESQKSGQYRNRKRNGPEDIDRKPRKSKSGSPKSSNGNSKNEFDTYSMAVRKSSEKGGKCCRTMTWVGGDKLKVIDIVEVCAKTAGDFRSHRLVDASSELSRTVSRKVGRKRNRIPV